MFANLNENRYLRPPHALWLVLLGLLPIVPQRASGQCTFQWQRGFGGAGADNSVMVMRVLDLGNGPVVVAGGLFNRIGDAVGSSLATWDGTKWTPMITGLTGSVYALAMFDDGTGPALYVGGRALRVNGVSVNGVGRIVNGEAEAVPGVTVNGDVRALEAFDDGTGPALYIAGAFLGVNSVPTRFICRWNGTTLDRFNGGVVGGAPNIDFVNTLRTFDAGNGPRLYAGGHFNNIGGAPLRDLAYWDAEAGWQPVPGWDGIVNTLHVADLGDGPALYIGGLFATVGGAACNSVARWTGAALECVGTAGCPIYAVLELHNRFEGGTPVLYAGGVDQNFPAWRWDGQAWTALPGANECVASFHGVRAMSSYEYLGRDQLLMGGGFNPWGMEPCALWSWTGQSWDQPPPFAGFWVRSDVRCATIGRIGGQDMLIIGGLFTELGNLTANNVAAWDGRSWRALGAGLPPAVTSLQIHDDGNGPALFAATAPAFGNTNEGAYAVYRWNGTHWSQAGDSFWGGVLSLAEVRLKGVPTLFAGGDFREVDADKAVPRQYLAQWDGAGWLGLPSSPDLKVNHITAWKRTDGERLLAGGSFTRLGDVPTAKVGVWDGTTWQGFFVFPADFSGTVQAVAGFSANGQDGVYACGALRVLSQLTSLARFDGTRWVTVPGAPPDSAASMTVSDLGAGPRLIMGQYASAGQAVTSWDGATWTTLASSVTPTSSTYLQFAVGKIGTAQTNLALVGNFDTVGPVLANSVAIYAETPPEATTTPASHRVNLDQTTSLFVRVPDPAATYQWFKDGQPLADGPRITGTQTPTLTIRDIQPGDDGWYEVEYRVACGATRPRAARLTVNPGGPCPADANGDRRINQLDLDTVLFNFGATVPPGLDGDLNGDGQVDQTDLDAVLSDYGAECA